MATGRQLRPAVRPAVAKVSGVPRELQAVQRNLERATEKARGNPRNDARTVRVNIPASGDVTVAHKLGRKPVGYQAVRTISGSPVYEELQMTSRVLVLTGTSAGIVDLEVW